MKLIMENWRKYITEGDPCSLPGARRMAQCRRGTPDPPSLKLCDYYKMIIKAIFEFDKVNPEMKVEIQTLKYAEGLPNKAKDILISIIAQFLKCKVFDCPTGIKIPAALKPAINATTWEKLESGLLGIVKNKLYAAAIPLYGTIKIGMFYAEIDDCLNKVKKYAQEITPQGSKVWARQAINRNHR